MRERERERERERKGASERERKKAIKRERNRDRIERERAQEHARERKHNVACADALLAQYIMQEATGGRTERSDKFLSLVFESPECLTPADSQDLFSWHAGDTLSRGTRLVGEHCYLSAYLSGVPVTSRPSDT